MGYAGFSRSEEYVIVGTAVVIGNLATLPTTLTGFRLWLAWLLTTMIIAATVALCLSAYKYPA